MYPEAVSRIGFADGHGGPPADTTNRGNMRTRARRNQEIARQVDVDLAPLVSVVEAQAPDWKPYIETRLVPTVLRYRGSYEGYRRMFLAARIVQVVSALSVPVLAARNISAPNEVIAWLVVILSLVTAAATGAEQVWRPGVRWRLSRDAHADIVALIWKLERDLRRNPSTVATDPAGHASVPTTAATLDAFATAVEDIITNYENDYLTSVAVLSTNPGTTTPPVGSQPRPT